MRLTNIKLVEKFIDQVDKCEGDVWLESKVGDRFNLKSPMSRYVSIGALVSDCGDELELFCSNPSDESLFYQFFKENPQAL